MEEYSIGVAKKVGTRLVAPFREAATAFSRVAMPVPESVRFPYTALLKVAKQVVEGRAPDAL
uniref:Uncharacterized protein n=1 Tax=Psilocybe cubensis TaxID=181762 RepID=A0A8H7Y3T7_PSICU